jgi:hypothetical protein
VAEHRNFPIAFNRSIHIEFKRKYVQCLCTDFLLRKELLKSSRPSVQHKLFVRVPDFGGHNAV